jgi:hypothetical protein
MSSPVCARSLPDKALHNASAFLSALGHVVVGWLWLDQALAAAAVSDTMREIRLRSCRYFVSTELPKARQQLTFVKSLNDEAVQFADVLTLQHLIVRFALVEAPNE